MADALDRRRSLTAPGLLLGFAFSGLFDGILLHQILQWHHLLSLVEGPPFRDLRVQVFADGAFHALMYLLAGLGLAMLWRRRAGLAADGAGPRLLGAFILGFGVWNVVDAVVFHWVLQIHHIRLDPDQALVSDVLWLALLGLAPIGVGWRVWRRGGRGGGGGRLAPAALSLLLLAATAVSLTPRSDPMTAVLFRPGVTDAQVLSAVAAVDGRLAWVDRTGEIAVIRLQHPADRWRLYGRGALLVGGAGPSGCLGWARPA